MIKIRNLNKYYHRGKENEIHVINNTTVEFEDTGLVCILGESGSGKTTLMNTISGLDSFSDGEIEVDNIVIKKYGDKNQAQIQNEKFGYIFQNYYLLQDRTVEYNLMLSLSLYNIPDEDKKERIDYVLRSVDMWKYKKRLISELSGGQQQRIAIARALAKSPKVIFADEPTGNLDEANTMRIMSILKKISKTCLVVVVTHEKSIAEFFADRILWISSGIIENKQDRGGKSAYEYMENTNLYLKEYESRKTESDGVSLTVYANEEEPEVHLRVIYENGKVYIQSDDLDKVVFLDSGDEKKMIDGKKPVARQEDLENVDFVLPHIEEARHPKMTVPEIMEIAKTNLAAMGRKKMFLILAMFVVAALVVLTVEDILRILQTDEKTIVNTDSSYYLVKATKNAIITDKEYGDYFGAMTQSFVENGFSTYIVASGRLTYQYMGYEQLEAADYALKEYFMADIENLDEKSLIYGTMPENDQQVVVDRWVLEKFIDGSAQVKNALGNVKNAVGSTITTDKGLVLTISGVCETNEPDIYLDKNMLIMLCEGDLNFRTDSKAKLIYEDYQGGDLGVTEDGAVKVLVDEKTLHQRFLLDITEKYSKVYEWYKLINTLKTTAVYEGIDDIQWGYFTPERAKEMLPSYEEEYEEMTKRLGITGPEYEELYLSADAYKDYTYSGVLAGGIKYEVAGYFPVNYGISYILSDESCDYIARAIMNTAKECYVYAKGTDLSEMKKKIEAAIPQEAAQNLTITITNQNREALEAYEKEKMQKLGARILWIVTIFIISMIILYFMMKANAVARMGDLGVYRMIGISKGSIVGMFAYESFLITSYTSLIGALLTLFVTYVISRIPLMEQSFYYPWHLFAVTVLLIYAVNILVGIMPIRRMLKLPPAQLAAKYDI